MYSGPIETHYSTLYPNPAGDVLVINKTPAASAGSGADITIYNTSGETLLTAWQKELPFTISTRTLPGGLYIVKVIMQGKVEILKFIKQ